jgi:branched-chain amino acid transport system substrate-binding protein
MATQGTASRKPWLLAGGVVALALVAAVALYQKTERQGAGATRTLKVAANLPMTGDLAVYGRAIRDGATMSLEEKAAAKDIVSFDWQDNAGDAQRAVLIARQQIANRPDVYTSALKPQVVAIEQQVSAAQIVHFPWVLDITINKAPPKQNFRVWVSFRLELNTFKKVLDDLRPKRVAIWYFNTEAAVEEYSKNLAPYARQAGAEVLEEVIQSDSTDYRATATRIQAFKPDFIFLNGFIPHMTAQIKALYPLGLIRPGATAGALDLLDAAPLLPPEQVEGILVAAPAYLVSPSPAATEWNARFEKKFNSRPTYTAAYAYDMATAIIRAAESLAGSPESAWPASFIAKLRQTSFDGITGPIALDDDQSLKTELVLSKYRNGIPLPTQR